MSIVYWLGTAPLREHLVQAAILTCDATPANTTYRLTLGGRYVEAAGVTNTAATATALAAAWNASTHPYFSTITALAIGSMVTLTGDTPGVPFIVTSSVAGGTGTIGSPSTTQAAQGPNHWSVAANWSGGTAPIAGDDVVFADGSVNVCWGLDQSSVNLASLTILKTYTGKIGLNRRVFATSSDGATTVATDVEYRDAYLKIGVTDLVTIGEHLGTGTPSGSGRLMLDLGTSSPAVDIHDTANTSTETALPSVRLLVNSATLDLYVRAAPGGVGVAVDRPGETSLLRKVSISDVTTAARVSTGEGVTLTTWEQLGGTNAMQAAATVASIAVHGGSLTTEGDYAATAVTIDSGTLYDNHVKTGGNAIATLTINGGTVDAQESSRPRTWDVVNLNTGVLRGDGSVVTINTLNDKTGKYTLTAA